MSRTENPTVALIREIGGWSTLLIAPRFLWRMMVERPFSALPAAKDRRERLSRKQALPPIVLYRVLKARYSQQRALEIMRRVVRAGAVQFLEQILGDLDPAAFQEMPPELRERAAQGWLARFFTATAELHEISDDHVSWRVTACALVRLSHAAGHPELAPTFCAGDAHFFATRTPPVEMHRPMTIADGGSCCPFQLSLKQERE